MSEISALESRITTALDRIRRGVEAQGSGDTDLQVAVDHERAKNAELIAAASRLKDQLDAQISALTERVDAQRAQMAKLDTELQRLRASNAQMREMNTELRETVTQGLAPDLINQATAAEITALQAQRSADVAEVDAILAALQPLMKENTHAAD